MRPSSEEPVTGQDVTVVLDVGTELSAATAAELRSAVTGGLRKGRTIHLQLGSVVSYDAVGMGLLVGLRRRTEAVGGPLLCVTPPPAARSGDGGR
jgi:anti-anti-sigma factor